MTGAAAFLAAVALLGAGAFAQDGPETAEPIKQIRLTEAQVKGFISAQPDLAGLAGKLPEDAPDTALQAELDGIAKKHGFADFSEFDDVAVNVSIVMAGLDDETGEFTEPVEALKKELADVQADAAISADDKQQLIEDLSNVIKTTPTLVHKENVDVVKAHREEIEKALE